jgi:hypothetical protein
MRKYWTCRKAHMGALVVLIALLFALTVPVTAQGPFPPLPNYVPPLEGWTSTIAPNIGGYDYMKGYFQNWQSLSEVTDYGYNVLGHRVAQNGQGIWIVAARATTYTAPMLGMGFVPQAMYGYSTQMSYDMAQQHGCPYGRCGPY